MSLDLSYCYIADDFTGHRPANRELVERVGLGAVYSWPATTTIHMDMMKRCRRTLDAAAADGIMDQETRPELAIIENEALKEGQEHRVGCSHSRTSRCICDYIAQWDHHRTPAEDFLLGEAGVPRYVAPTFRLGELSGKPVATPESLMAEIDALRAEPSLEEAAEISAAGRLPEEDLQKLLQEAMARPITASHEPAPFPLEEKDYYPIIEKPVKALTVNGEIWEPRRLRLDEQLKVKYWYGEYKDLRRRLIGTTIFGSLSALVLIVTAAGRWAGWF